MLIENYRPGVAARLGADYETLRAINPRLIYASISGFGQTGPYAQRPGFDLIAQGAGGRDERHRRARRQPGQVRASRSATSRAGLFCAVGILSALHARERTGEGQQIDTSLCEGALALSIWETAELWATGRVAAAARLRAPADRALPGAAHARRAHHGRRQQPEAVGAAVRGDRARRTCPATRASPTNADRMAQPRRAGRRARGGAGRARHRRLGRRAARGGRPARARSTTTRRWSTTRTRRRVRWWCEMEHPEAGTVYALGIPVKLSATPGSIRRPAPLLGQHTDEILREASSTRDRA